MRSRPRDSFDEWFATTGPQPTPDPRFRARTARLDEFERIYDAVDDAFGVKRPRAVYDWQYRLNPLGPARIWLLVESDTDAIANLAVRQPWPLAYGDKPREGAMLSDSATVKRWQRQGIGRLRVAAKDRDAWRQRSLMIAWPNEKSRRQAEKLGTTDHNLGPLPRWVLPLHSAPYLRERGWPAPLARITGSALDLALRLRLGARAPAAGAPIEELAGFDAAFDALTARAMAIEGYWCPHDAEFLNWRYAAHPAYEYVAFAASAGDDPAGYGVVRLDQSRAILMEWVFPREQPALGVRLLHHAAATARDAGCRSLEFMASRACPHEALLTSLGFRATRSDAYFNLGLRGMVPAEDYCQERILMMPGDQDGI